MWLTNWFGFLSPTNGFASSVVYICIEQHNVKFNLRKYIFHSL